MVFSLEVAQVKHKNLASCQFLNDNGKSNLPLLLFVSYLIKVTF